MWSHTSSLDCPQNLADNTPKDHNSVNMKKSKKQPVRQSRPLRDMQSYVEKEPRLQEAMRLFDIGMKQYARSLSYLSHPQVISRADTQSS